MTITYMKGDATSPQAKGKKIIVHVCNDIGKWGKGFVMACSKRWPSSRQEYLSWYNKKAENDFGLGAVQFLKVEDHIWLANMVGQKGIKKGSNGPPIRYEAIQECLEKVASFIKEKEPNASVHMPRIGCGLAGGKWDKIEEIVQNTLVKSDIPVYVYDYGE